MIEIQLNGEVKSLHSSATIAEMVTELGLDSRKIAIEQNRSIIPKSAYSNTLIAANDAIEIVAFMGGG